MSSARPSSWWYPAALVAVMMLAVCLRVYGIDWGVPSADHPDYSYFPDERAHLELSRMLSLGHVVPNHFIYGGTLYFSLLNFFVSYADMFSGALGGINLLANSILFGRYFLAVVALVTLGLVYATGKMLFDRSTGLLAALLLAINPAHIIWAQHIRPDELAAFFTALIMFFSAKILKGTEAGPRRYVYAGISVGAAVATRVPLAVFGLVPVVAHLLWMTRRPSASWYRSLCDKNLLIMSAVAIGTLFVLSYHTFFYFDTLLEGLRVTWSYESGIFLDAIDRGPRLYQFSIMTLQALGPPVFVLAVMGLAVAIKRRSDTDRLLLAAFIPYFLTLGFASWVVVRYTVPLVPVLVLVSAWFVHEVLRRFPQARLGIYAAVSLVVGWTLVSTLAYAKVQAGKDTRDVAAEWIQQHTEPGARIIVTWNYQADDSFNPVIKLPQTRVLYEFKSDVDPEKLLHDPGPRYLVLNELVYKNMDRLGDRHPMPRYRDFHAALLRSDYRLIREFKHKFELFGFDFSPVFSAYDFSVANPGIRIYQRN